jgi:chemotaxis receptor (MCP) glutamine deamidase CheD
MDSTKSKKHEPAARYGCVQEGGSHQVFVKDKGPLMAIGQINRIIVKQKLMDARIAIQSQLALSHGSMQ